MVNLIRNLPPPARPPPQGYGGGRSDNISGFTCFGCDSLHYIHIFGYPMQRSLFLELVMNRVLLGLTGDITKEKCPAIGIVRTPNH